MAAGSAVKSATYVATMAAAVAPPDLAPSMSRVTVAVSIDPTEIREWANVIRASRCSTTTPSSGADPDPDC